MVNSALDGYCPECRHSAYMHARQGVCDACGCTQDPLCTCGHLASVHDPGNFWECPRDRFPRIG